MSDDARYFLGHEIGFSPIYFCDPNIPNWCLEMRQDTVTETYSQGVEYTLHRRLGQPHKDALRVNADLTCWPVGADERLEGIKNGGPIIHLESLILERHPEIGRALSNFRFLKMPVDFALGCHFGESHVFFQQESVILHWKGQEIYACEDVDDYQEGLLLVEDFCQEMWDQREFYRDLGPIFDPKPKVGGLPWFERL